MAKQRMKTTRLGPPFIRDPAWCSTDETPSMPILPPWIPPNWINKRKDGGIIIAPNTVVFQRGHAPQNMVDQYFNAAAKMFHHPVSNYDRDMKYFSIDFFVLVLDQGTTVASGCMVEFRCDSKKKQPPYLYIGSLFTSEQYANLGLAHQVAHGVCTLGALMLSAQSNQPEDSPWRYAIPDGGTLYAGLTVVNQPLETHQRLLHMYGQCGFTERDESVPQFSYRSFTPWSQFTWRLDENSKSITPLWKHIPQDVLYEDPNVRILNPNSETEGCQYYYHAFPKEELEKVRRHGLVHLKHQELHPNPNDIHVCGNKSNSNITFTKVIKGREGIFGIKTEKVETDEVDAVISIATYMAHKIALRDQFTP